MRKPDVFQPGHFANGGDLAPLTPDMRRRGQSKGTRASAAEKKFRAVKAPADPWAILKGKR